MLGTALLLLVALLAVSVPVAAVMGVLGLALNQFFSSIPLYLAMGDIVWNAIVLGQLSGGEKTVIIQQVSDGWTLTIQSTFCHDLFNDLILGLSLKIVLSRCIHWID